MAAQPSPAGITPPGCPPPSLRVSFCGLELASPIVLLSGCVGFGEEYTRIEGFSNRDVGAIVLKGTTGQARLGNPPHRVCETAGGQGMINAIGLQNPGVDHVVRHILPTLDTGETHFFANVSGSTIEEYVEVTRRFDDSPVTAIEVNISCPNVDHQDEIFACDPDAASHVVQAVRRHSDPRTPILVKLSPDVTDITVIAKAVVRSGANCLSVINTTLGMVIDVDTMRPKLAGVTGGLSGPAIRPIAVRCVWQIRKALPDVPILGMGGIRTGLDALQFILAGANAVSVGTMIFNDPSAALRIQAELALALHERGFSSLREAISYAHRSDSGGPAAVVDVDEELEA